MNKLPFFHKPLALFLLEMCEITYEQYKQKGLFAIPEGFTLVESFKAASIQEMEWFGFIIESDDAVVIAFRGTQSEPDWIADARVYQTPFPYLKDAGLVHTGFLTVYDSCRDSIFEAYKKVSPHKTLYITGHSLGAALATLHALDARVHAPFDQVVMYNYASPRVGDKEFTIQYRKQVPLSIRFVNVHDIVTKVPPTIIYCPITKQVWYYAHVKSQSSFSIQTETIAGNHSLVTYKKGIERFM
ncbi:lipase [Pontibacillus salipaludis]|uniref:Lipase n=2 Tax=Pontibacillus salipaludis TaxID=1697394 RepID=A0ABQ1PRB6_9BACI|nr:lipase [Pontibacillus salipaludis]